jgi:hypothetical protein
MRQCAVPLRRACVRQGAARHVEAPLADARDELQAAAAVAAGLADRLDRGWTQCA